MKRTAATLALLAGFGGGCASTDNKDPVGGFGTVTRGQQIPNFQGPNGEPIMAARGATPSGSGVTQAGGVVDASGGVKQVAMFEPYGTVHIGGDDCPSCAHVPGSAGMPMWNGEVMQKFYAMANGITPSSGGPGNGYGPPAMPSHGILPVPGQGPPGAVAAVGALPLGAAPRGIAIGRSSIKFTGPAGMRITWQMPGGGFNDEASGLTAPKEYNFVQGQTYRLRLTQVLPNFPGRSWYPTLEVSPGNPKTLTFLAHSSIPLTFTNDDFEQAKSGNLVVKVIYLPDRENQDFATIAGAEELVSTRLEPGADPVAEAQRKGTVMAIVRLGNIDLENHASPPMTAPLGGMPRVPIMLPGPGQTIPGPNPVSPPKVLPTPPLVPKGPVSGSGSSGAGSATFSTTPGAMPPIATPDLGTPTALPPIK